MEMESSGILKIINDINSIGEESLQIADAINTDLTAIEDKIKSLESNKSELNCALNDNTALQQQITTLKQEHKQHEEQIRQIMETHISEKQSQIVQQSESITKLELQKDQTDAQVQILTKQIMESQLKESELKQKNSELEQKVSDNSENSQAVMAELAEVRTQLDNVSAQKTLLERKLEISAKNLKLITDEWSAQSEQQVKLNQESKAEVERLTNDFTSQLELSRQDGNSKQNEIEELKKNLSEQAENLKKLTLARIDFFKDMNNDMNIRLDSNLQTVIENQDRLSNVTSEDINKLNKVQDEFINRMKDLKAAEDQLLSDTQQETNILRLQLAEAETALINTKSMAEQLRQKLMEIQQRTKSLKTGGKKTQRKRRRKKHKTLKSFIKKKSRKQRKQKKSLAKRKGKHTLRKRRKYKQRTLKRK